MIENFDHLKILARGVCRCLPAGVNFYRRLERGDT